MNKKWAVLCLVALVAALYFIGEERRPAQEAEQAEKDNTRAADAAVRKVQQKLAEQKTPEYQIGLARFALKQRLRDPESAQFRNEKMFARGDTLTVCGEVNSRNGFGGLSGFKWYASSGGVVVMWDDADHINPKFVSGLFARCE